MPNTERNDEIENLATFSWWTRGGEPGPGWTSDKLDLSVHGTRISGIYTRARYNDEFEPPFRADEFTGSVPVTMWEELRQTLSEEQILDQHDQSEDHSDWADLIKDEIALKERGAEKYKLFFGLDYNKHAHSIEIRDKIISWLSKHGSYRQLNNKASGD